MIKAVIFDLDGVISDTDRTRFDLLKILLERKGLLLKEEDYEKSIGKRTETFLKELFSRELSDQEIKEIYSARKEEYHKNPANYIISQPSSFECCKKLYEAGFTLAIASASEERDIRSVLNELKLLPFFKIIVGSDKIKHAKPNPETYLKCVENLKMDKKECVAIEDSPIGVESAKGAGVMCIAVTYTHEKNKLEEADKIITSLAELTPNFINE